MVPSPEYLARTDGTLLAGPFRCRSDDNGFIRTGNSVASESGSLVFLGGSFVESIYSQESDRFVSVTERNLIQGGHLVNCLNGGYSGSTTLHLLNVILNKIYPLIGPGGTIVFFGPHSDRDYIYNQGSYWSDTQRGSTIVPPGAPAHTRLPRGVDSAEMVLRLVVSTTQQLGLNLILATSPYREGGYDSHPLFARNYHGRHNWYRSGMSRRKEFVSMIRRVASDTGTPMVDAQSFVDGRPSYFYDELHLNPEGHELVAGYLAKQLPPILEKFEFGSSMSDEATRLRSVGELLNPPALSVRIKNYVGNARRRAWHIRRDLFERK